jgi:hypothetical protein
MTTVYIGPYLVIPPTPRQTMSRERVCSKHCDAPAVARPAKFCGNCGGVVIEQDVPVEVVEPLPLDELPQKWTDYMSRPEYGQKHPKGDIWLPNQRGHGIRLDRGSEDVFVPITLASIDGDAMLETAKRYYDGFLTALKADYGIEPVWEVGVVAWSN